MKGNRPPGKGTTFVGIAAASFATGPCMMALGAIGGFLGSERGSSIFRPQWSTILQVAIFSSLLCLIGSIPAASVNAYVVHRAARSGKDTIWVSALSGGIIGVVTFAALVFLFGGAAEHIMRDSPALPALFAATGACMGLLHWAIAIRPRRRWRLHLMRDEEAIRAME